MSPSTIQALTAFVHATVGLKNTVVVATIKYTDMPSAELTVGQLRELLEYVKQQQKELINAK